MNVSVNLAGHSAIWHFPGTPGWRAWIASRPWQSGRVISIDVSSIEMAERLSEEIGREAAAAAWPSRPATVVHLPQISGIAASDRVFLPLAICAALLDAAPLSDDPLSIRDEVAGLCSQPTIAVVICKSDSSTTPGNSCDNTMLLRIQAAATTFAEAIVKGSPAGQLSIVLLAVRTSAIKGIDHFDFRYGIPLPSEIDLASGREDEVWAMYKHFRLAWEVDGNLALAERWALSFDTVPYLKDEMFEKQLNATSAREFAKLSPECQSEINKYLSRWFVPVTAGAPELRTRPEWPDRVDAAGLTRRHAGDRYASLCPWIARAILVAAPGHDANAYLRHRLRCEPLADELLSRCATLEAHIRAVNAGDPSCNEPEPHGNSSGAEALAHYPACMPSPPGLPNDFLSFGDWIRRSSVDKNMANDLRRLRNAMAHGHYCSWFSVSEFRKLWRLVRT